MFANSVSRSADQQRPVISPAFSAVRERGLGVAHQHLRTGHPQSPSKNMLMRYSEEQSIYTNAPRSKCAIQQRQRSAIPRRDLA